MAKYYLVLLAILILVSPLTGQELGWDDVTVITPLQPASPAVNQGNMVTHPEFVQIKILWIELAKWLPNAKRDEIAPKKEDFLTKLNNHLKTLEEKSLSGRWMRSFLETEFAGLFRNYQSVESPSKSEDETIADFWKEVNFCYEGLRTLLTLKEYDSWIGMSLAERTGRTFRNIRSITFKKRMNALKRPADQYKETLIRLTEALAEYKTKTGQYAHNPTTIIGKSREQVTDLMAYTTKGNWVAHNTRKENEFFETDLLEFKGKEDKKVILMDRRFIMLEAESIITGWELNPQIPEDLDKQIIQLITDLAKDDWEVREKATEELSAIGEPALERLKEAQKSTDPEVKMRVNLILKRIEESKNPTKKIREFIESYINQRQVPPIDQLLQMGEIDQVLSVVQAMADVLRQREVWTDEAKMTLEILEVTSGL